MKNIGLTKIYAIVFNTNSTNHANITPSYLTLSRQDAKN